MSVEATALARFKALAAIPNECQLERRIIQGKLCLRVDCPSSAIADTLWRNQYTLVEPLKELGLAERAVILHRGRVWHPAFRDLW
jgi:hypothetical protein